MALGRNNIFPDISSLKGRFVHGFKLEISKREQLKSTPCIHSGTDGFLTARYEAQPSPRMHSTD